MTWIRVEDRLPEPRVRVLVSEGLSVFIASRHPDMDRPHVYH